MRRWLESATPGPRRFAQGAAGWNLSGSAAGTEARGSLRPRAARPAGPRLSEHRPATRPQRPAQLPDITERAQDLQEAGTAVRPCRAGVVRDPDLRQSLAARAQLDQQLGRKERRVGLEPQP